MNEKRYAIVRVDNMCPEYIEDFKCHFPDNSVECMKCNHHRYGDTKEQLIKKAAQILFKKFMKTNSRFKGLKKIQVAKRLAYKLAKEIVEFLGVEDDKEKERR